jgi:two-component system sensor histidine kinase KdpD
VQFLLDVLVSFQKGPHVKGIQETNNMTPSKAEQSLTGSGKDFQTAGGVLRVLGVVFVTTGAAFVLQAIDSSLSRPIHSANLVMPYLMGIVWSALHFDRSRAILSVVLNVISFCLVYIRPISMQQPDDLDYILILVVFLFVAISINELSFKARRQAILLRDTEAQIDKERMKNTLLRSVSHDLRSPLSTIMGAASSLLDASGQSVSAADTKELALSICRESKRLDRQVANLLEMTSLESGGLVLNKDWYALDEMLGNALTSLEIALADKEIDIQIPADMPLLYVDGLLIEKVFINLIENCIKYGSVSGQNYRVKIVRVDGLADIEVFNSGSPINPGEEERIFEKFYRSVSTNGESDGAGLGLAICQSILELHGGKICAVPGLKDGVAIRFQLPLSNESPQLDLEQ